MISVIYAILFYVATIILVVGVAAKIRKYARTPAPLKIPTTPAPTTRSGVVLRMFREVVFFESLFKSNNAVRIFCTVTKYACMICENEMLFNLILINYFL